MLGTWISRIVNSTRFLLDHAAVKLSPAAIQQTRFASKGAGGVTKNKKRGRKRSRGIKVEEGQEVQRQHILCTQLQLRYYPGENVGISDKMTLDSLVDGKVMITKETLNPYPDSPIYPGVQSGDVIERIFLHVIPHDQENKFKLVSLT